MVSQPPPESVWNPNNLRASLGFTQLQYNPGYTADPRGRRDGNITKRGTDYSKVIEARNGFLYIFARSENNARDAMGQYTQWVYDQDARNEAAARAFQEHVLNNIKASILRPKVSTGRLLQVTANRRNIDWSPNHWAVGNPNYLDSSQAKYWRTQEEGSAKAWKRSFIGDPLVGLWAETIGPFRGGYAGGKVTRAGANRQGKFMPYNLELRLAIVASASGAKIPRVKRHIRPMNAYKRAWAQSGGSKKFAYHMFNEMPGFVGRNY